MPLKWIYLSGLGLALSLMTSLHAAPAELEVCKFKDDKPAALSMTFDDGLLDHYTIVKPMLKEAEMPATFFVVPAWVEVAAENAKDPKKRQYMSWEQIRALAEDGHEIGNHAYSHGKIKEATDEQLQHQVVDSLTFIEEKTGMTPQTFCFPGNARDERGLEFVLQHHINARTRQFGIGNSYELNKLESWIKSTISKHQWGVAMIHAIIPDYNGYSPLPNGAADFQEILDYLQANRDELWIDTFAAVSKYEALRDNAEIVWDDAGKSFTLKTDLDPELYDVPLSIKVTQDGESRLLSVMPNTTFTL